MDVPTAMALIEVSSQEKLMALVEDGSIRWAFDIGLRAGRRREVRMLGDSINEYLSGDPGPLDLQEDEEFQAVLKCIFPSEPGPVIRSVELERALNASQTHIKALVVSGEIAFVKGSEPRPGPYGSAIIQFSTVVDLLKRRRLP